MGRRAQRAWSWITVGGKPVLPYKARFSWQGERPTISTGSRDEGEATQIADREYLAIVSGQRPVIRAVASVDLVDLVAKYFTHLRDLLPKATVDVYEGYGRKWVAFFSSLSDMIEPARQLDYMTYRLKQVVRKTHRKERTKMRSFFAWCVTKGALRDSEVPKLPDLGAAQGTRKGKERVNVELTVDEVRAIISHLPEYSARSPRRKDGRPRLIVRAFFEFLYETGLRPITVKRLVLGTNWRPGDKTLVILNAQDKAQYGREVPLSERAIAILDQVAMSGSLFGHHDLRKYPRVAAVKAGLPPHKAEAFAAYDFRHARATHLLDAGAPLTAVAYLLGHKQVTTTNFYVRAQRTEAAKWI